MKTARRARALLAASAAVTLLALGAAPAASSAATPQSAGGEVGLGGYLPFTSWLLPTLELPERSPARFLRDAERGMAGTARWRARGWYCEFLRCAHGPYPMATLWGAIGLFEAADAIQIASPSGAHRAVVRYFGEQNERFWSPRRDGYAPYPGTGASEAGGPIFFDDDGWEGLAYFNAYRATGEGRWLRSAQRAFRFVATHGWDARGGGGIWWNTSHPYRSGPALAADTLLGTFLYLTDHRGWQIRDVLEFVNWANRRGIEPGTQLWLDHYPGRKTADYVEAPLIYAEYLLCSNGFGAELCERAGRAAATVAETRMHPNRNGEPEYEYRWGPQYDAVFLQWMLAYGAATHVGYWQHLAELNADAADAHSFDRHGLLLGSWWGGPIETKETKPNMLRTPASTASLFAWLAVYAR